MLDACEPLYIEVVCPDFHKKPEAGAFEIKP